MTLKNILEEMKDMALSENNTLVKQVQSLTEENALLKERLSEHKDALTEAGKEIERLKALHDITLKAEELAQWEMRLATKEAEQSDKEYELTALAEDREVKKLHKRLAAKAQELNQWRDQLNHQIMQRRNDSSLLQAARVEIQMLNTRLSAYATLMKRRMPL